LLDVLIQCGEVEIELPKVLRFELAALQFHRNKAAQFAIKEKLVYEKFYIVNGNAILSAVEAEFIAKSQSQPPPAKAGGLNIFGDLSRLWSV
jgi:hypothetical protein